MTQSRGARRPGDGTPTGSLQGAAAVVTGAARGIGAATAARLLAAGARVAGLDREFGAEAAPGMLQVPCDITDRASVTTAFATVAENLGPVQVLVNNAGKGLAKDFLDSSDAELMELLDLNVTAVLRLTRAALPGMVKRGFGGIVNVASIAGVVPGRGGTYGASKAWVIAFSEAMHMEYAPRGVRVQALCPGFVRTEFHERAGIDMQGTPAWMYVDADKLVTTSLADLRLGRPVSIPGALYRTVAAGAKVLPRGLIRSLAMRVGWKPAAGAGAGAAADTAVGSPGGDAAGAAGGESAGASPR